MTTNQKPTLGYWAIRGLGSQIRYQLVYLGVDYTEDIYEQGDAPDYSRACWLDKKDTLGLQFPNLPYYLDGNMKVTEAMPIMKYIAYKYDEKLLGHTPKQVAQVEMVAGIVTDLKGAITMPCYTTGDRATITMNLLEKVKPLVAFLADKSFLVGENVTYIDFVFFELIDFMTFISQGQLFQQFESLEAYHSRVKNLPKLKEFYADDERCVKRPFNNKIAKLNN